MNKRCALYIFLIILLAIFCALEVLQLYKRAYYYDAENLENVGDPPDYYSLSLEESSITSIVLADSDYGPRLVSKENNPEIIHSICSNLSGEYSYTLKLVFEKEKVGGGCNALVFYKENVCIEKILYYDRFLLLPTEKNYIYWGYKSNQDFDFNEYEEIFRLYGQEISSIP